ncbi:hypothetical protein HID58_061043, partial [Brassica napus]
RWKKRRKRNGKICICVTLLIIFLFFIILHVLALTFFKPKCPITTIDALNLKVILNLTLQVNLSFGSSSGLLNYGGKLIGEAPFRASQIRQDKTFPMNVTLTFPMNVTLTLMADRPFVEREYHEVYRKIYGDPVYDTLMKTMFMLSTLSAKRIPLKIRGVQTLCKNGLLKNPDIRRSVKTFVKVVGKVSVLNMFKIKVESSSSCDITISISNRNVTSQHCKSSTRL